MNTQLTSSWKQDVTFRADAIVTAVRIDASSHTANKGILKALVDVLKINYVIRKTVATRIQLAHIPMHIALASSIWYPSLQVHMKLPKVLEQRPFWHKLSISVHSSMSSKTTWREINY